MDGNEPTKRSRLAILSPSAAEDLAIIYTYTAQWWGYEQAERYTDLIKSATEEATNPEAINVREVEDRPGYLALLVQWKNATYGHFVIFRRTDFGAEIVRILHTSMDLSSHIPG